MTQRNIYTLADLPLLLAKGRAEQSRVLGRMVANAPRNTVRLARAAYGWAAKRVEQARIARELHGMDNRMLADIGLTPGEIELVAAGKLSRGSLRPVIEAANESVAPAARTAPKAA